ncbi:hypothetical protein IWQ61_001177 [Dispira simplex]|nr:hypothetical protein IWQ61_001177 [Dispira simplex]
MKTNVLAIALLVLTAFIATASATDAITDPLGPRISQLDPFFKAFNTNHGDTISAQELAKVSDIRLEFAQKLIKNFDMDNDGELNSNEFYILMNSNDGRGFINALFRNLDKDGNGSVSKNEFVSGLNPTKDKIKKALLNALFDEIDSNKNGFINEKELSVAFKTLKSISYPYDNTQA